MSTTTDHAARAAAYAAADAAYDAAAARIAEAEALIREAIAASIVTDATATVYLWGLSAEEACAALSRAAIDSDGVDSVEALPGEMIEACATDDHGRQWRIEIELRVPA